MFKYFCIVHIFPSLKTNVFVSMYLYLCICIYRVTCLACPTLWWSVQRFNCITITRTCRKYFHIWISFMILPCDVCPKTLSVVIQPKYASLNAHTYTYCVTENCDQCKIKPGEWLQGRASKLKFLIQNGPFSSETFIGSPRKLHFRRDLAKSWQFYFGFI